MNNEVVEIIKKNRLIVIVRGVKDELLVPLADALYKGGVRLMEITYDATGKTPDREVAKSIKKLSDALGVKMYIGAGTVLKKEQVALTAQAGGKFILSPNTDEKIIRATKKAGLVSIPSAFTPTEIVNAYNLGGDFVKLFPASAVSPDYVKAVKVPLSHIPLIAMGGVDLSNLALYAKSGVFGFGIGSGIVDKAALSKGDFSAITEYAQKYVDEIKKTCV